MHFVRRAITSPLFVLYTERSACASGDYEAYRLTIDLEKQTVSDDFGWTAHFEIEPFEKKCLLEGLDDIALTLAHEDRIVAYEKTHPLPHRFE